MTSVLLLGIWRHGNCTYCYCVFLLFWGKKIPELMKGLGKGISEFKKGTKS